jgi:hypothetical protein
MTIDQNILLNVFIIYLFIKFIYLLCNYVPNEKKNDEYYDILENFNVLDLNTNKLKYDDIKKINNMINDKDIIQILKSLKNTKNNIINEFEKLKKYNDDHGFPMYGNNIYSWNEIFPKKMTPIKTYNNEEYYKKTLDYKNM